MGENQSMQPEQKALHPDGVTAQPPMAVSLSS